MGCLFAVLGGLAPRFAFFVYWILRPAQVDAAFDTWIFPLLARSRAPPKNPPRSASLKEWGRVKELFDVCCWWLMVGVCLGARVVAGAGVNTGR
jgi:hypothetical protein